MKFDESYPSLLSSKSIEEVGFLFALFPFLFVFFSIFFFLYITGRSCGYRL
jgi:hypothetical protein